MPSPTLPDDKGVSPASPLQSTGAWEPIETAPRDGTTIIGLSYFTNGDVSSVNLVQWITAAEIAEHEGGSPDEFRDGWDCEGDEVSPLFWMPFPPPPEQGK